MSDETTECPNGDCGVLLNRSDVTEDGGCRYCLQNSDALARWAAAEPSAADGGDVDAALAYVDAGPEYGEIALDELHLRTLAASVRRLREEAEKRRGWFAMVGSWLGNLDEQTMHYAAQRLTAERDQLRAEVEKADVRRLHVESTLSRIRALLGQ